MNVTFYINFRKRRNSTLRPSGGTEIAVTLKDDTSVLHPTLIMSGGYKAWNYCYIPTFDRYYFIDDIVSLSNNRCAVKCTIDVLASWRTTIRAYNTYVERASQNYSQWIYDSYIPQEVRGCDITFRAGAFPSPWNPASGTYMLTVVGGNAASSSQFGVTTYAVTMAQIKQVLDFAFDPENFIDQITDEVVKTFFNPFQYIVSCMWLPVAQASVSGSSQSITLGWWNTGVSAPVVTSSSQSVIVDIALPDTHFTDFRRYDTRWTRYFLYVPTCGNYELSAMQIGGNSVRINMSIDLLTGDTLAAIITGEGVGNIAYVSGNAATDISLGQLAFNSQGVMQGVSSLTGGIMSLVSGGSGVGSIISGAFESTKSTMQPMANVNGSAGSMGATRIHGQPSITAFQRQGHDMPTTDAGRPVMQSMVLSNFSGYVKCLNASLQCSGYAEETALINSYLNGGFYCE